MATMFNSFLMSENITESPETHGAASVSGSSTMTIATPPPKNSTATTVTPPPICEETITLETIKNTPPSDLSMDAIFFIMRGQPDELLGSATPTETHSHQGYGGLWFRDYAHAAKCKSAFNKQFINVKLGVGPVMTNKRTPSKRDRTILFETPRSVPTRSSRRIAKLAAPDSETIFDDDGDVFDDDDQNDEHSGSIETMAQPVAKRPRKFKIAATYKPLSPEQFAQLEAYCETHAWLDTFDSYLANVEQISAANKRNVLRQSRLLVNGQTIGYQHWPQGVAFNQARAKIHLGTDLMQLLMEADAFEREHGRDLGNGWLLRHPIQKLINYQRHVLDELEQPRGSS
ncbi:hypothetical protein MPSEU_000401100 [Mayamaea pseudoterrestris]|nr:hypothetical protein MPSEU_000401100 [Mayamaea pseudoterrestris]